MSGLVRRHAGWVGALVVVALVVPVGSEGFIPAWQAPRRALDLAGFAAIYAVVAYGLALLTHLGGLPSVVHGALWGVGGYVTAVALNEHGLGFWLALPLAAAVPAAVSVAVGLVTLRTSGTAFIVSTLAMGSFIVLVLSNWRSVTGGPRGIVITEGVPPLGPVSFDSPLRLYYLELAVLAAVIVLIAAVGRTAFARRSIAVRDNERLARSLGIDPLANRLVLFAASSAICGVGGALFVYHQSIIEPRLFDPFQFIAIFLMVILGGAASLAGPLVGAWLVTFLPDWVEPLGVAGGDSERLVYGLLLMVAALALPRGLVGAARDLTAAATRRRRGAAGDPAGEPPVAAIAATPGEPGAPAAAGAVPVDDTHRRPLLVVRGLTKRYDSLVALDGVDLTVDEGTIHGLIGPNGSGKTTLFNCVSGFTATTAGTTLWDGAPLDDPSPQARARRGLVRTFQQPMVFPSLTVAEACRVAVEQARRQGGRDGDGAETDLDAVVDSYGLEPFADVRCDVLPYGVTRRLSVALAVEAARPRLLMLDEPAAGLNDEEDDALALLVRRLRARGVTVLLVDHDMPFLLPLCDRVTVLDSGRCIFDGVPADVQADPRVVAAYLGEHFASRLAGTRTEAEA